jgi:hypothetical protein
MLEKYGVTNIVDMSDTVSIYLFWGDLAAGTEGDSAVEL